MHIRYQRLFTLSCLSVGLGLLLVANWGLLYAHVTQRLPFNHMLSPNPTDVIAMPPWPGIAIFDYDSDSDLDIYMTNGTGHGNGLLRNDGSGAFADVGKAAGVAHPGGTGVVSGDINNDGGPDLFMAGQDRYAMYLNEGNGNFVDITSEAGLNKVEVAGEQKLGTSTAFCDFDSDGYIDLYVARMDDGWSMPKNEMYRNNGDLTFSEIAEQVGADVAITRITYDEGTPLYTSWAVACLDYDNDFDQDLLVAVDFSSVALFHNQLRETGELQFDNVSVEAGLGATGNWMGLAILDYNRDGWLDVFASNWGTSPYDPGVARELDTLEHALYRNNGDGTFTNVADSAGVASWEFGWGASPLDWDNDGNMDLYYAGNMAMPFLMPNGEIQNIVFADDNPGHLFLNNGDGTFIESSAEYELRNEDKEGKNRDARAVAVGDLNGDGFFEILVGNSATADASGLEMNPGVPAYFENPGNHHHWLKVRLVGNESNHNGLGAKVFVVTEDWNQIRDVRSGSSFQSQDSYELGFGLGRHIAAEEVVVVWPSGIVDRLHDVEADQTITIVEGSSRYE